MSIEAMKQALEAFGEIAWSNNSQWQADRAKVAITALRAALAEQPAEQSAEHGEPVAWRVWRGDAYELFFSKYAADRRADCFTKRPDAEPLYTSPPASKPWVGLTRDERMSIINRLIGQDWVYALDAIEAKLKEKNT